MWRDVLNPRSPQGEVAEWSIASVLKTEVGQPTVGSNPTLSANKSLTVQGLQPESRLTLDCTRLHQKAPITPKNLLLICYHPPAGRNRPRTRVTGRRHGWEGGGGAGGRASVGDQRENFPADHAVARPLPAELLAMARRWRKDPDGIPAEHVGPPAGGSRSGSTSGRASTPEPLPPWPWPSACSTAASDMAVPSSRKSRRCTSLTRSERPATRRACRKSAAAAAAATGASSATASSAGPGTHLSSRSAGAKRGWLAGEAGKRAQEAKPRNAGEGPCGAVISHPAVSVPAGRSRRWWPTACLPGRFRG